VEILFCRVLKVLGGIVVVLIVMMEVVNIIVDDTGVGESHVNHNNNILQSKVGMSGDCIV